MPRTSSSSATQARAVARVAALIISLVLALVVIFSLPTAAAQAGAFSDVTDSDWFYEAVESLAAEGALGGYSDGTFRPTTL